ncbi:glycosyltransferase [bacterium]|nr:glycosyltransferase [bacterium]
MPTPTSIVIPVHNAASTIEGAVQSLDTCELEDVEIIVVDDGSNDETAARLDALVKEIEQLHVFRQDHLGIVQALQRGLREASGNYIARMDADDISLPGRIERQRRFLDEHPQVGLVTGKVRFGGNREAAGGYAAYVDWINTLRTPEQFSRSRFVESPLAHPAVMYRAQCVREHGGYRDGPFPEDYELWLRWLEGGVRFASIPDEVLLWNDSPERLSRTHARYDVDAFYTVKSRYLARWCVAHVRSWPEVVVWGAGRITRKRVRLLEAEGARIRWWVDIDAKKIGQRIDGVEVIAPENLPAPGSCFVLPYVGSRDARAQICDWLETNGYVAGRDFLPAA